MIAFLLDNQTCKSTPGNILKLLHAVMPSEYFRAGIPKRPLKFRKMANLGEHYGKNLNLHCGDCLNHNEEPVDACQVVEKRGMLATDKSGFLNLLGGIEVQRVRAYKGSRL